MTLLSSLPTLLLIFLFILLAALGSASEAAVLAASRVRLYHLAKKGNKKASALLKIQEKIGEFISSIILLNTWAITIITALATGILTSLFGEVGTIYAGLGMGALITIYAEVLPKLYVYRAPDRMALAFLPFFKPVLTVMSPFTKAINFIAQGSLQLVGVNIRHDLAENPTGEELRGAIELHTGLSGEVEYERAMLRSILDLTTVEVTEIMRHRKTMFVLNIDEPKTKIIEEILQASYTRIPLWKDNPDNIVGMIHVKDLFKVLQLYKDDISQVDLKKIITPPWFIPETTTLFSQLAAFRQRREHFALVIDEYGDLQGMVTLEDILEEIVGEIVDEHDVENPGIRIIPDGTYVVDGIITIRDLNRLYGWDLPDDRAATLAGLVLYETREIPEVGQSFLIHGFRIDILRRYRHQVTQLRVTPPQDKESLAEERESLS
jgi:Mg2+/Co2+ transporter CorB